MNKYGNKHYILLVLICSFSLNAAFYKSLSSLFSYQKYEEVEQKDISLTLQKKLILENSEGNITIKSWRQPMIILKTIKRASQEPFLPQIIINTEITDDEVIIKTVCDNDAASYSVEYDLLIPENVSVSLKENTGNINVGKNVGDVLVNIDYGNVSVEGARGSIEVEVAQKGSVTIEQPGDDITVSVNYGNITIYNSKRSVYASTNSGKIKTECKFLLGDSSIELDAYGTIILSLPPGINADINADTQKGTVTSEHYMMIKPFITQLNNKAWLTFKRIITGTLGNGGPKIDLRTVSGNIKIIKNNP